MRKSIPRKSLDHTKSQHERPRQTIPNQSHEQWSFAAMQLKTCLKCGTEFGPSPAWPQNFKRQKYCSKICARSAQKFEGDKAKAEFWSKVQKGPGCWLWTGAEHIRGYGACGLVYGDTRAHRASWKYTNGPIPEGMYVLHTCDTPLCVNPDHLYLGTQQNNVDDAMRRGRHGHALTPLDQLLHPHLSTRLKAMSP